MAAVNATAQAAPSSCGDGVVEERVQGPAQLPRVAVQAFVSGLAKGREQDRPLGVQPLQGRLDDDYRSVPRNPPDQLAVLAYADALEK